MSKVQLGWLCCAASIALVLMSLAATFISLTEAYGTGPPYFGRTQNMDKWSDPIPVLAAVDILFVAGAVILWRIGNRLLRSHNDA